MELSRQLLKDFAEVTAGDNGRQESQYLRGTIKNVENTKYVKIDGSQSLTPLSEVVDVDDGDRVLVLIDNHEATVLGNLTFPPSARKEQEAIDKAEDAQISADDAIEKAENAKTLAQSAGDKADAAVVDATNASASANEAKQSAQEAITSATTASTKADEAKNLATTAGQNAATAREEAALAQNAATAAQGEVTRIEGVVTGVKGDIDTALKEVADQAADLQATKETLEVTYAKKTEVSDVQAALTTEISKKVGELQTTVSQTYAAKNDVVAMEGRLQSQITQTSGEISSVVGKVEQLESDTTEAQKKVDEALEKSAAAQVAAGQAQANATAAQTAADAAKANADNATKKANEAVQNAANAAATAAEADRKVSAAKTDLDEAKVNLENTMNRVGATEQEIADAQQKVDAAQAAVTQAQKDAATATAAANNAQNAANKAQTDATEAQNAATNAQKKADNAAIAAGNAQAAADKAQQDVAALTSRVTTAETEIRQNTESITLAATKAEEIGKKLDTTNENLQNNYYSKTQTDAAIKVAADNVTTTVRKEVSTEITNVNNKVDNLQVGGRNLLKNTGADKYNKKITKDTLSNYVENIEIVDNLDFDRLIDKQLTLSFRLKNDGDYVNFDNTGVEFLNGRFGAHITVWWRSKSSGATGFEYLFLECLGPKADNNIVYRTHRLTPPAGYDKLDDLKVNMQIGYKPAQNNNSEWFLGEFKLEIGNKYTDWSPAPEDMATADQAQQAQNDANEANGKVDATEHRVSVAESTIKQLSDSISMLVTDSNGSSMMTQTSDGWTFNIGSITDAINSATNNISNLTTSVEQANNTIDNLNQLANDLSAKTAYINMTTDETGAPCIELGKSGNAFKVRITNTSVDFIEGSSKIAYVSNQALFIEKAIIKSELQVGETRGFIWKTRSNGNMGLRWFG